MSESNARNEITLTEIGIARLELIAAVEDLLREFEAKTCVSVSQLRARRRVYGPREGEYEIDVNITLWER